MSGDGANDGATAGVGAAARGGVASVGVEAIWVKSAPAALAWVVSKACGAGTPASGSGVLSGGGAECTGPAAAVAIASAPEATGAPAWFPVLRFSARCSGERAGATWALSGPISVRTAGEIGPSIRGAVASMVGRTVTADGGDEVGPAGLSEVVLVAFASRPWARTGEGCVESAGFVAPWSGTTAVGGGVELAAASGFATCTP